MLGRPAAGQACDRGHIGTGAIPESIISKLAEDREAPDITCDHRASFRISRDMAYDFLDTIEKLGPESFTFAVEPFEYAP
jgi:hypothetical protein